MKLKLVTVGEAKAETRYPCDIDAAGVALSQAAAILDLLAVAAEGVSIPDTYVSTLTQAIYAAHSEVQRAHVALFGEETMAFAGGQS